jgi:hypothetical protein
VPQSSFPLSLSAGVLLAFSAARETSASFTSDDLHTAVATASGHDTSPWSLSISGHFLTTRHLRSCAPGTARFHFFEAFTLSLSRYDLFIKGLPVSLWRLPLAAIARFSALAMPDTSFDSLSADSGLSYCFDALTERLGPNFPELGSFNLTS